MTEGRSSSWLRTARWIAIAVLPAALASIFWRHALGTGDHTGWGDWQFFHHMWEVARAGLERDGALPLWNPHHCGGLTYFGNPQSQAFSPLFPLVLVFGTTWASKLFVVVHTGLALLGAYRLGEVRLGLRPVAAWFGASVWALSGFWAWHAGTGHVAFVPFAFAPWVLLAMGRAHVRPQAAAAVAAWMALSLLEGGIYPTLFLAVLLVFDVVAAAARGRFSRTLLWSVGASAFVFLFASAVRTIPVAVELFRRPRPVDTRDSLGIGEVFAALTTRAHAWRVSGHPYVWAEYGAYVGWAALGFAAVGLVVAIRRGHADRAIALAFFVALAMGARGSAWPWSLLGRLPVYGSLRVPSRFLVLATLEIGLLAALGMQALVRRAADAAGRRLRLAGIGLFAAAALLVGIDLLDVNGGVSAPYFREPPIDAPARPGRFFLAPRGEYARFYASYPAQNRGSAACYEGLLVRPARGLWSGERPQMRVEPPSAGEVREKSRTADDLEIDVRLDQRAMLIVNQNFDPDWSASVGDVRSQDGLLAVSLPNGRRTLELSYRPWSPWPGFLGSFIGWITIAWMLRGHAPYRKAP